MRLERPGAGARILVWLLPLVPWMSGCSTHEWKKHVLYSRDGIALYAEHEEKDGREVPKGFAHPVHVTSETVEAILAQMVYKHRPLIGRSEDLLLFGQEDVTALAEPIRLALGGLTPERRLRFLIVRDNWTSLLTGPKATSGVMFVEKEGTLNVALDRIRESVSIDEGGDPSNVSFPYDPIDYREGDPLIPFRGTVLHVDEKTRQRFPRWLVVDLAEVKPLALKPAPPPEARATVVAPGTGTHVGAAAGTVTSGSTEAGPPPAPAVQAETGEERYSRLKEKLETLKRLKAEGVLTDEQYQEQFQKIMSDL